MQLRKNKLRSLVWRDTLLLSRIAHDSSKGYCSDPFLKALGDGAELRVYLAWCASKDQAADGISSKPDIRERSEYMNFLIAKRNSSPCGVLDGVLRLTVLASDTADAS